MGYILMLTTADSIHMYNMMGDFVAILTADYLQELDLLAEG